MKKKILLIGSNGFIGRSLSKYLRKDYVVFNLNRKISNGYTFGNSNDSIMECLKYYFQLYASTIPSDIDDKDILLVKKMSTELFGDYDSFLFISNIIDDDIIFKGAVIFMLNNFNKRLSEHKIILIPYIRKN